MAFEKKHFSYLHGLVQNCTTARAVAQIDQLTEKGAANATLIKWVFSAAQPSAFNVPWYCTRMAIQKVPRGGGVELIYMGPDGHMGYGTTTGDSESPIWPAGDGPDVYGVLRDLRTIGEGVYAVGMGRQVYRRNLAGAWERKDAGTLQDRRLMHVVGFNAIHGIDEAELYAVGFAGEVWRCHAGRWEQLDSPTNVILNAVHMLPDRQVVVAGKNGFLMIGSQSAWEVVETGLDAQIWDIQYFNEEIFFATSNALYRLDANHMPQQVDMRLGEPVTCGQLDADDGILLSTGRKHQCWSADGSTWHELA
ncbi:hypothetical protein L1F06_011105 [Ectopseudomonas hydrolytica]|uniref:Uncharacterized protein n=1 Tax=Ectopseudomonas hydrolytica TaxID=2493633 RepID=A0ABY5ADJ7_9GAMM|nr:hypothetical protein [Pseudomonas hydrolytica]USR41935.1 hypothetical protein L1F06_011105 [Pseudomonas hydrolytica]